ncbi:hypothetical protein EVAR_44454_1 [Eumeta japonica]|uniref:Uncharacterized protein n=1 Tax=Eumeta variegata TaxID=151549 RepID=A0A4C1WME6_EUMVA|nr:hypothetical protein EVAR_44454_1 [Eumeta japonica]
MLASGLTQIVSLLMILLDVEGHNPSLLDLLLTLHCNNCKLFFYVPLVSLDYCLVQKKCLYSSIAVNSSGWKIKSVPTYCADALARRAALTKKTAADYDRFPLSNAKKVIRAASLEE